MPDWTAPNPDFAARTRDSFARQPFMNYIAASLVEIAPGRVSIELPFRAELTQQHGFFHGGVIGTLADNAGGYATMTMLPASSSVLTVEYKLNIMAPGRGERLLVEGEVVRAGRRVMVCRSDVFALMASAKKLIATALGTFMVLPDTSDHPEGREAGGKGVAHG